MTAPTQSNHLFRTFLGLPPDKGDKPVCGADLPDSWDFPGHDRPLCHQCIVVAYDGKLLTDEQANLLPTYLTDENCSLELISSTGVPTPDFKPEHVWRLHIREVKP